MEGDRSIIEESDRFAEEQEIDKMWCWVDSVKMGLNLMYGHANSEQLNDHWDVLQEV